jgi:DNA-binding NarL/FixJ family response regulator
MNRQPIKRDARWTPEEDELLRELARSGHNPTDISKRLNRSSGSVRMRAARLKIVVAKAIKLKL